MTEKKQTQKRSKTDEAPPKENEPVPKRVKKEKKETQKVNEQETEQASPPSVDSNEKPKPKQRKKKETSTENEPAPKRVKKEKKEEDPTTESDAQSKKAAPKKKSAKKESVKDEQMEVVEIEDAETSSSNSKVSKVNVKNVDLLSMKSKLIADFIVENLTTYKNVKKAFDNVKAVETGGDEKMEKKKKSVLHFLAKHAQVVAASETKRVRVENTGVRTEIKKVYADTKANQELGRVGKEYTVVIWKDAEFKEVPINSRKLKYKVPKEENSTGEKPVRANPWIDALTIARGQSKEFITPLKVLPADATEKQRQQHEFYLKTVNIMNDMKKASSAVTAAS